jgi:hypothetical protein
VAAYEADGWEPPAPVARAIVRGPAGTAAVHLPMLIDSGSDVSVMPSAVVQAIGATVAPSPATVGFHSGAEENWDVAHISVEFERYRFAGPFLVSEAGYGIIGRNILNLLTLTLDGPSLTWSSVSPRS